MRLREGALGVLLALALAPGGARADAAGDWPTLTPAQAANLSATASASQPLTAAQLQAQISALGDRLAEAQAHLEDVQPDMTDLVSKIQAARYGGSTNPAVSGDVNALFKDAEGFGAAGKNGSALFMKLDLDVIETLPDSSVIHIDFGPAFSPGQTLPPWNVDDPDEEHVGLGTATRLGTLMSNFNASIKKDSLVVEAGVESFSLSPFSVAGQLSQLPYLFDMNVYRDASTSKSFYDSQFLTGVVQRDPTESEHPIMGVTVNDDLSDNLSTMLFTGNFQNYYTNSTMPHEYGGDLRLDESKKWGGVYKFIGYNHSNDTGEILTADGSPLGYFGLMNNTVFSVEGRQKLGKVRSEFEVANSAYDDSSGYGLTTTNGQAWGGVHVDAQAWRFNTETHIGNQILRVGIYGVAPDYLVTDPQGYYNNDGTNLPRYRPDPNHPGQIISQTVVADPTLPMNDTITYHISTQLRAGSTFLNLRLQNSMQTQPSDSQIWASHYEGGANLGEGTWFVFFNNNYQAWLPPDAYKPGSGNMSSPPSSAANGVNPYLERQFNYNQQVSGPTPAFPTTLLLNNYDNSYAPTNANSAMNSAGVPGAVGSVKGQPYLYNSYHDLETDDLWRGNMEGIVNTNAAGQAYAPSIKDISCLTADMRTNLGNYLPLQDHDLFWQVYGEVLTVNNQDSGVMLAPSLSPTNLFVQSVLDSTFVYNLTDSVNLLLNLGVEDWATNEIVQSFVNQDGQMQNGTLAYFDREAGVGMDWNFIPNKLNLYFRVKLLDHYDAFCAQNNFQARQMWWQLKTYF